MVVVKKPKHLSVNFAIQAKVITLELRQIEIRTSSRARTTDQEIEVTSWLVSADDFSSRVARGANERVSAANE